MAFCRAFLGFDPNSKMQTEKGNLHQKLEMEHILRSGCSLDRISISPFSSKITKDRTQLLLRNLNQAKSHWRNACGKLIWVNELCLPPHYLHKSWYYTVTSRFCANMWTYQFKDMRKYVEIRAKKVLSMMADKCAGRCFGVAAKFDLAESDQPGMGGIVRGLKASLFIFLCSWDSFEKRCCFCWKGLKLFDLRILKHFTWLYSVVLYVVAYDSPKGFQILWPCEPRNVRGG